MLRRIGQGATFELQPSRLGQPSIPVLERRHPLFTVPLGGDRLSVGGEDQVARAAEVAWERLEAAFGG